MLTGSFKDWTGEIAEIGAIYPFEGSETIFFVIAVILWLSWHIKQAKDEQSQLAEEERGLQKNPEYLRSLLNDTSTADKVNPDL